VVLVQTNRKDLFLVIGRRDSLSENEKLPFPDIFGDDCNFSALCIEVGGYVADVDGCLFVWCQDDGLGHHFEIGWVG
jgi:hypothetical protein